jgi:ESS family glutamate:Na+ symporter
MNALRAVIMDGAVLSLLLLIGVTLRKHSRFLQNLYLPASLIAGFVGLLLGPQILGHFAGFSLPIDKTIAQWPGQLTSIVLGLAFVGTKPSKNFGRIASEGVTVSGLMHQTQVLVGLGLTILLIPFFPELPVSFGFTPVFGFHGGHGTANAVGVALAQYGWPEGISVANTMATAGLMSGIILGMIVINIGVRRGYAQKVLEPQAIPQSIREGIVPEGERKSIGSGVTYTDSLDPLALQLAITGVIFGGATLISKGLVMIHPLLKEIPHFACAMVLGATTNYIVRKVHLDSYIDRATINRISGVALDYLVCAAIATLSLKVFSLYLVPLVLTITIMIIVNLAANFYFSWKIFDVDWFERAVASYGLESGVLATGLMLLRVVDPRFETTGQDSVASAVSLLYPLAIPYVVLMPLLSTTIPAWILWLFSFLIWLAFYCVARRFYWHKDRHFSDILSSKSKAPCVR